jgi:hypothetical protein
MGLGGDQLPPWNVIESPVVVTAMQNREAAQATEISDLGPETWLGIHLVPLNAKI